MAGAALQAGAVNRLEQRLALLAGSGDKNDVAALYARGIAGNNAGEAVDPNIAHETPPCAWKITLDIIKIKAILRKLLCSFRNGLAFEKRA
jgi:hypothetical protein